MTSTRPAADPGSPNPRRTFLRQLAALPLIGGGLTLIGQPTAVAAPVTLDLMQSYKTWLHYEHRSLAWEMADHPKLIAFYGGSQGDRYHWIEPLINRIDTPAATSFHSHREAQASSRAALVISAVGCDWREQGQ